MISRIDLPIQYDLRSLVEELEGLWCLSSPSFSDPTLHKFVRGLIFSEKILQIIDMHLSKYNADWGQIVDEKTGNYLSKECDIIIYKGKPIRQWGRKSIRFVIVGNTSAKLVIQCSTSATSLSKEHKEYPNNLKKFVPELWYLAECYWGSKNQCNVITKELKKACYDRFFYLYREFEKKSEVLKELNYNGWNDFIKSIRNLK